MGKRFICACHLSFLCYHHCAKHYVIKANTYPFSCSTGMSNITFDSSWAVLTQIQPMFRPVPSEFPQHLFFWLFRHPISSIVAMSDMTFYEPTNQRYYDNSTNQQYDEVIEYADMKQKPEREFEDEFTKHAYALGEKPSE